jgi:hypothetical protein
MSSSLMKLLAVVSLMMLIYFGATGQTASAGTFLIVLYVLLVGASVMDKLDDLLGEADDEEAGNVD